MATRVIDDSKLQDIAVAIQSKDGGGQMAVDEMPTRSAAIPTRDNTKLNSLIDRSITIIENDEVTSIGSCAFYSCSDLTSVSFPNVTSIDIYAFQNCSDLSILILGKRAILSNSNAFIGANNAIIYVKPEDLSWYSTATNWSVLYTAGRVKSIEELPT